MDFELIWQHSEASNQNVYEAHMITLKTIYQNFFFKCSALDKPSVNNEEREKLVHFHTVDIFYDVFLWATWT